MEENHDADPLHGATHGQGVDDGGVLGATQQPLVAALFGGLNAAASVLAIVFLAGGVVRRDYGMLVFGVALALGGLVAAAAPRWLRKGQFARTRMGILGLFIILGLAVAGRGLWALVEVAGERLQPSAPEVPPGWRDVLIVTLDEEATAPGAVGADLPPGVNEVENYFSSSPRLEPCLASILTGLEVIEHRLLFDGEAPGSHVVTIAEILLDRGYSTHGFGRFGMPGWARRGVQEDSLNSDRMDTLVEALALLGSPSERPRFVHVHLKDYGLARAVRAATRAAARNSGLGPVVAVVQLPSSDASAPGGRLWWAADGAPPPDRGPVSSVSILPALLACAGVPPLGGAMGEAMDGAAIFGAIQEDTGYPPSPAVTFAHGAGGAVHDLTAQVDDWTLELTVTPLGRDAFDDWQIGPPLAGHFVYGNGVRALHRLTGEAPDAAKLEDLIRRLADWRSRNSRFEKR